MVEFRIAIDGLGADLAIESGDLALDLGLETTVLASLQTDRRVAVGDVGAGDDRRGYWADDAGARWGSTLWLLERAKRTPESLTRARAAALEAARWLVDEGMAGSVDAATSFGPEGELLVEVTLTRPDSREWADLWEAQGAAPLVLTTRVLAR